MDWVDALKARLQPRDPSADLVDQNESEIIGNALESTASVAFDMPVTAESKKEAIARASREIAERTAEDMRMAAANEIRVRLASSGICPVDMGVSVREPNGVWRPITKAEWEGASDARWVEKVATAAALEYEKRLSEAWQKDAIKPAQKLSSKFDPETMRSGRIMSATAADEETMARPSRVAANQASILDPYRIDKFATEETEHDKGVAASRQRKQDREDELKGQHRVSEAELDTRPDPMKSGHVQRAGGMDRDVFQQRVPRNQISMVDTLGEGKLTGEELKERLSSMFGGRVEDNGASIREANAKRKEEIQGKQEKDRSWEKLEKPLSTADLMKRLAESWMPPEPGE